MSIPPPSSSQILETIDEISSLTTSDSNRTPKLRKIPHIPSRHRAESPEDYDEDDAGDAESQNEEEAEEEQPHSAIILASALGLDHIRTRSLPSPRRFSSASSVPFNLKKHGVDDSVDNLTASLQNGTISSTEQGKKVQWSQSKSSRILPSALHPGLEGNHAALAKEIQSPRVQAILRVTSSHKKRGPDVKSFSHELNAKGVRPLPFWKSRAFGRMEEIMVMVRSKFEKLKVEVNSDLGIFAGDLVGILEQTSEVHPELREGLEDLLVLANKCAKMSPDEFWLTCESIVQTLDDRRQELPMGTLKQVHTRLLFILTRCTRLVQFQKESSYKEDHILACHQLSDLGVYSEQTLGTANQEFTGSMGGKEMSDRQNRKAHGWDHSNPATKHDQVNQNLGGGADALDVGTAKSVASSTGSYRMSSWKKLPSAAERNQKGPDSIESPYKDKSDCFQHKDEATGIEDNAKNLNTPICHTEHSETSLKVQNVTWGVWGDHHNLTYENSLICRICEVEIPTVYVEEHSKICAIADRCDLKGLAVNERLDRVAEALERILESWTPKSSDTAGGSPRMLPEELDEFSPKKNSLSPRCSGEKLDFSPEADTAFIVDELNNVPDYLCETQGLLTPDLGKKGSSPGSLTPRSPLLTPRTNQIELLLSGRRTISEHENYQQIHKLLDIARSIANLNNSDYSALGFMLDRLEDLKYAIQDRKVDALVVETFGRRIEKLLQEKYVILCGQIEDEKIESSNTMTVADEDSSAEDDTVRSLRASPMNLCSKDRTSIEDFEIIKPISRGAFGRVFLARKRATGDLFAIKVLKKADMIRKNAVESILAERDILISVRNPFVVRFFYSFTCRENLYLVMEYLNGGDLYSLLKNLGCLEEDMARVYIAELVLALEYLHSLNVIHRDLKPDNLLIGPHGHIKLTDFGLSKVGLINSTEDLSGPLVKSTSLLGDNEPNNATPSSPRNEQRQKHSVVGTPDYLPPEILLGMGHGATADWWSVGIILFELLVGIPPFNAEDPQQIFSNIMNRDIQWPKVPEEISHDAHDLIVKLLIENPVQRLGATGAGEVKRHPFFRDINWDTLARQKATFIPSAEALDTSYFMSRYIWNAEEENVHGFSDFEDMTASCSASCSSSSYSNVQDEEGDEFGNLADFSAPALDEKFAFSNFSFKNLSQLASINYDMVVRSAKESVENSKPAFPH